MNAPRVATRQQGAAILLALLIMTLVATLAAGMVWLQWRGIEVESSERARTQGEWLLNASLDWGNLILKSSIRSTNYPDDDLGQPWATPLAETKLSSFLSADGSHSDDSGPEAYLSGQITDATSKYNLYNLVASSDNNGNVIGKTVESGRLQILCSAIGVPQDAANAIIAGMRASYSAQQLLVTNPDQPDSTNSVLMPIQVADLAWFGIDPKVIKQLEPFVQLIPLASTAPGAPTLATPINANTAPAEVLMAGWGMPAISRAQAEQLILQRQQKPLDSPQAITSALKIQSAVPPAPAGTPGNSLAFKSQYFEIYGQLRYEQHVIRERSVVYRKNSFDAVQVIRRERIPPDPT